MNKAIQLPCDESTINSLKIGDSVSLSGSLLTARDVAHKFITEKNPDFLRSLLKNSMIYHCGPVVSQKGDAYIFRSAGPTTSFREEKYEHTVIKSYQVRGVIGKGGMGQHTLDALKKYKAVYLHTTGGAASLLASYVTKVIGVYMLEEFGSAEAMWHIEFKNFPALVTMDSHGNNLHKDLENSSKKILKNLFLSL